MATFYSSQNLILYALAGILLMGLISLAVLLREGQWPVPVKPLLWLLILATAAYPLSRTCPYPAVISILRILCMVCLILFLTIFISTSLFYWIKKRSCNLFPMTQKEADRWISHSLRGTFLVSDPSGNIIGGHLRKLPHIPGAIDPGLTLMQFFQSQEPHLSESRDYENLLRYCPVRQNAAPLTGSGTMRLNYRYYQWTLMPLGEQKAEGYLFAVQDLSEEYHLYKQREEQQRLMKIRLERLEYQSDQEIQNYQNTLATETIGSSAEVLKKGLGKLLPVLDNLHSGIPGEKDKKWEEALELSSSTMMTLRKTIHEMDSDWRKIL